MYPPSRYGGVITERNKARVALLDVLVDETNHRIETGNGFSKEILEEIEKRL